MPRRSAARDGTSPSSICPIRSRIARLNEAQGGISRARLETEADQNVPDCPRQFLRCWSFRILVTAETACTERILSRMRKD